MPPLIQFFIEPIQVDIGQQRREDSLNAKANFEFDRVVGIRRREKHS